MKRLVLAALAALSLAMPLSAQPAEAAEVQAADSGDHASPQITRAEETEWYYRVVDGKLQRRLWSITYGKWITDWEWV